MKSCPLCHRLYTQLMNYCFDDGKSLVEETAAPGSEWVCPNCKAYERVYGRKAHEPLPLQEPGRP